MGKKATSPASIKVKSVLYAERMHPADSASIGFKLTAEQAIELATKLMIVATCKDASGVIYVTGKPVNNCVSVIRCFD